MKRKIDINNTIADRGEEYRRNCIAAKVKGYNEIKNKIEDKKQKENRIKNIMDNIQEFK